MKDSNRYGAPMRPEGLRASEKAARALQLRKAGLTWAKVAEGSGYRSAQGAQQAVSKAMKKLVQEPAEELLELELARLDDLQAGAWEKAEAGDARAREFVLKVMEQRAKYKGLYENERRTVEALETRNRIDVFEVKKLLAALDVALVEVGVDALTRAKLPEALGRALESGGLVEPVGELLEG